MVAMSMDNSPHNWGATECRQSEYENINYWFSSANIGINNWFQIIGYIHIDLKNFFFHRKIWKLLLGILQLSNHQNREFW